DEIAAALLADADRFTRVALVAPRLAPAAGRERVTADPFAWEVAEQEEALTRVWSAVYALRAELLAVERLISLDLDDQQVAAHAVTAAWRWALASTTARTYTAAFTARPDADPDAGSDSARAESAGAELVALAGWAPPLTPDQQDRLRAAAAGDATRAQFVAAMHDDIDIGTAWIIGFVDHAQFPDTQLPDTRLPTAFPTPAGNPSPAREAS
ncbi:MAG: hypothetical protein WAK86_04290, partial [Pseudonocardiaceae bacterium]